MILHWATPPLTRCRNAMGGFEILLTPILSRSPVATILLRMSTWERGWRLKGGVIL